MAGNQQAAQVCESRPPPLPTQQHKNLQLHLLVVYGVTGDNDEKRRVPIVAKFSANLSMLRYVLAQHCVGSAAPLRRTQ